MPLESEIVESKMENSRKMCTETNELWAKIDIQLRHTEILQNIKMQLAQFCKNDLRESRHKQHKNTRLKHTRFIRLYVKYSNY